MDSQTRLQVAATLRAAAQVLRASGHVVEESSSPLDYHGTPVVKRLAIIDPSAPPPDPKDYYFAGGGPKGKKKVKPPTPGTVAFIDYSLYDDDKRVFIHFMETRRDQRKKGNTSKLLDHLYDKFKDAAEINWGKIMSDEAERLFRKYQAKGKPETRGKL